MRKLGMVLTVAILVFPVAALIGQEGYYSGSYIRLNYVQGEVVIQRAGNLGYEQGEVNLALTEGDKLAVKVGRAELHFGKNNFLRVNDASQVEFVNLPRTSGDPVKLNLLAGDVYLRVRYLEREKDFEVHTPDASFYILEEGLYRFTVRENEETELRVYQGSAEAAAEEGSIMVQENEQLFASDGKLGSHIALSGGADDFSVWNGSRDDIQGTSASTRYLPSEISEYESELDNYGNWTYERPYGYVWVPTSVYSDWRPYYYGRWVWYPIIGWTWVSSEPWGWAAYHYGRWHWRLGLGWHWIPTAHWGPAWVHWYRGFDYYGWCPLSYYNRPGVIINNNFYDRYNGNDYPLHSRALTMVHRNQLQDPQIHRVALSGTQIASLGKVSLKAAAPDMRPSVRQSVGGISSPAKIFSGGQLRKVEKNYNGGGVSVSSPRIKSTGIRSVSRDPAAGTASSRGGILRKEGSSSGSGPAGGVSSSARSSIRKITPYPSTESRNRMPGSSISGKSGGVAPRDIRSNSGSSFRDDVSPSRSRIKSYSPSERTTSNSRSSISPSSSRSQGSSSGPRSGIAPSPSRSSGSSSTSKAKTTSYPSSSRITKKSDSGGGSYSLTPRSSSSSVSGRSSGYIRNDTNYIRSLSRNNYSPSPSVSRQATPSIRRSETPRYGSSSTRSYSVPRSGSPSSRSYSPSRSSSSAPRISAPSSRIGSSSGSAPRSHSGSSSTRSSSRSSSGSSSGRIVKKK